MFLVQSWNLPFCSFQMFFLPHPLGSQLQVQYLFPWDVWFPKSLLFHLKHFQLLEFSFRWWVFLMLLALVTLFKYFLLSMSTGQKTPREPLLFISNLVRRAPGIALQPLQDREAGVAPPLPPAVFSYCCTPMTFRFLSSCHNRLQVFRNVAPGK